ncbi:hypothetical protein [Archangium lipolyticum]|uniref:hypothetical protein n=1 Tax=Archangium lipolyticum TaxID=2970465 RepID=UPI0021499DCD|nr:hypothetical protein [Archangium lipolyticum]
MKRQAQWMGLWSVLALASLAACGGPRDSGEVEPTLAEQEVSEIAGLSGDTEHRNHSRPPEQKWVRMISATSEAETQAIAHDPDRNVIVMLTDVGGPIDFGTGPVSPPFPSGRIGGLAKYSPEGSLLWAFILPIEPTDTVPFPSGFGFALATDGKGNILLSLVVGGRFVKDGLTLTSGEYLLKLDKDGRAVWARRLPTRARALTVDDEDNIAITGTLEGTTEPVTEFDFGNGPIIGADFHAFVARYSPRGKLDWVFVDDEVVRTAAIKADSQGNFYFAGIRFPEIPSGTGTPYFRKVSCSGEGRWSRMLEGSQGDIRDLAVRGNTVVVVGSFFGSFHFNGRTFSAPPDDPDRFVLALSRQGQDRWGHQTEESFAAVEMDSQGGVLVAGGSGGPDPLLRITRFQQSNGRRLWARTFAELPSATDASLSTKDELAITGGRIYILQLKR